MSQEIRKYLREHGIKSKKYIGFFEEYINNGGNASKAYKTAVSPNVTDESAKVLGSKLLKKINISEALDVAGLGLDSVMDALRELRAKDPGEYLKYYDKFAGLSQPEKIEVNHTIDSAKDKLKDFLKDDDEQE